MQEQDEFILYPKCDTLVQEDTCGECRYKKRADVGKTVIGIFIGTAVLIIILMLAATLFSIWAVFGQKESQAAPDSGSNYESGGYFGYELPDNFSGYNDSYGPYVPSPDDKYYQELTDSITQDLSYNVVWESMSLRPSDSNATYKYDCSYPVLSGKEKKKLDAVNQEIEKMACEYRDVYQDYDAGVLSYGYVTYMDEDKISVVIRHSLSEGKKTAAVVRAATFRMDTGEKMSHSDMVEVDEYLVYQFRSRNTYQNGEVEYVDGLSDTELLECLKDKKDSIMFYTPVGLEIGFNYKDGWVTVTLKNYVL